jgi:PAS domain S-box-containing protein
VSAGQRETDNAIAWGRALFDAIDDAVFVHDLNGNLLDANPAACRRLGYTREELLRLTTRDIDDPAFAAGYSQRLDAQLRDGRFSCEGRHRTKDGRIIPVDINTSMIDMDGQPVVLAAVRDITERKKVEEELRRQSAEREQVEKALRDEQAFYHSLVECLPQNIFRKDREGRVTFGNGRYCATVKRSLPELLGKTDFDLFPPELAVKYRRDDQHVMETGSMLEAVEQHRLPDGTLLHVQVVKTPVRDGAGNVAGTQCIFWDVTERVRAEEAIAASEHRYRQLTEATLDAIILADQDGRITLFNPAAERLFGYTAAEVVGQSLTCLMSSQYQARHEHGLGRYVDTRVSHIVGRTVELHGRRKDGTEFPMELALSAIELKSDQERSSLQFLGAIRDLTERNRIRAVLVQNEKLASIGLLSAGVAHEINNPLAFVANNLAVLERDSQGLLALLDHYESCRARLIKVDPTAARRAVELAEEVDYAYVRENLGRQLARTRDGVDRVTRIVQSLRGLARTDVPHREETNLPDLVDASLEMIRGRMKRRGISVELDYDPVSRVRCVATQIGQVLLNLLVNALQAIEATSRQNGHYIRVRTRRCGDEMFIDVEDTGCGIDPKNLPHLFDPFFTTKDVGEGTGLGLSITHNIVTGHGGRVEVESELDRGTRFRVRLPLHEPEPSQAEADGPPVPLTANAVRVPS